MINLKDIFSCSNLKEIWKIIYQSLHHHNTGSLNYCRNKKIQHQLGSLDIACLFLSSIRSQVRSNNISHGNYDLEEQKLKRDYPSHHEKKARLSTSWVGQEN